MALMADSSFLNTPRIIRIGLELVGKPDRSYITTSNGIIEVVDVSKKKVLFKGKASKLTITAKKNKNILLEISDKTFLASSPVSISNKSPRSETITLTPTPKKARTYRGNLEVSCLASQLYWVSVVDMEDYLKSVVPSEISTRAPIAAIEAQAIAARTYAVRNIDRHTKKENFNLCDTVHCQAYLGILKEDIQPNTAIKATEGKILVYDNTPANTVYHSNCGGYIISSQTAWGGQNVPYLIGHYDGIKGKKSFCEYGKSFLSRQNNLNLPEKTNRLVIGVTSGNSKKKTHSNYGHRVGMCQDGAIGMALIGYSCSNILGFYYPRTKIETLKYASRNTSNKYAPTQVTSLEELKANSKKKLKEPPVLKEIAKTSKNKDEKVIVENKPQIATATVKVEPAEKTLIAANTNNKPLPKEETQVKIDVKPVADSKKTADTKAKQDSKPEVSAKAEKASDKTETTKVGNKEQKAEKSKNIEIAKTDNRLKDVLKQISNTKPNSASLAIRKTFWRPAAPSIFTSSK